MWTNNSQILFRSLYILTIFRFTIAIFIVGLRKILRNEIPVDKYTELLNIWIFLLFLLTFIYIFILKFNIVKKHIRKFAYLQLLIDVIIVEVLILLTGGIESWFSFLLILVTIAASVIIGKKGGYIVAIFSALLYGILIDLQYYNIIPIPFTISYHVKDFFYNIIINFFGLYLTAVLMGFLVNRLEKTSVTLQKKDTDLKELSKFQSEIIENIPSGLFTTDKEGKIILFNKSAEKITGKKFSDIKRHNIKEIFPFLGIPPKIGRSQGIIIKDKQARHIGMNVSIYYNSEGKHVGFIGTFQDVTYIIKMEQEIKNKERLAAIGELSASIAHELRNPLASIKSSFEMLREGNLSEATKKRLMDIAISEMDRLNSIVTDFLVYSKPNPPQKKLFILSTIVKEVIDSIKRTYINIKITEKIKEGLRVVADEQKIRQVLWNILVNAVEATNKIGEIFVILENKNHDVILKIKDNGCGISKEEIEKIFYPFFSKKKDGTGLGLAIAYRIIEEHGGSILVDSEVGKGTEFIIILPSGLKNS